jgi:hypothetical protein
MGETPKTALTHQSPITNHQSPITKLSQRFRTTDNFQKFLGNW